MSEENYFLDCRRESLFTNTRFLFLSIHSVVALAITLCISIGSVNAQWKKIFDFGYNIQDVYFKNFDSIPLEGFISLGSWPTAPQNKLWRTTDGGKSWQPAIVPLDKAFQDPYPRCITFKNRFEGWFCEFDAGGDVYGTSDGGTSWRQVWDFGSGSTSYLTNSIFYVPSTTRLLIAAGGGQYLYSLDGVTYNVVGLPNCGPIGIAFSDNIHGIMTTQHSFGTIMFTSDGGITWSNSSQRGEQYQPIGIMGTTTFYAISEEDTDFLYTGNLVRSQDGGKTWKKIYQYHNHIQDLSVTGTLQYNSHGLFFQTATDTSEGIMMSSDSGYTFSSLCGPPNTDDTRFYVRDSFIYAGDRLGGLWLNTTGIGSNSTPQLSLAARLSFQTAACKPRDSIITLTFFDSCNGHHAELSNASVSGSTHFSLTAPFNTPRTIHEGDSILIHYDPTASLSDSAALHLKFHLGWKDFDTAIELSGINLPSPQTQISLTKLSFPGNCTFRDSVITLSCFDSCTGAQATLDSAAIQGSNNFTLLAPLGFPRILHSNDSLVLRYHPLSFGADTAQLHLHFHLGAKNIDTLITLFGKRNAFPQSVFSVTKLSLVTQGCTIPDSVITFSYFDSCSGTQATLLSAQIQGSNAFALLVPASFPRQIHPNDSLLISYNPQTPNNDTAKLLLHFQIGDQFFDTVISLFGAGRIPKETVKFIPSSATYSASSGAEVDISYKPDKTLSGRGLNKISFDLTYNGDLLNFIGPQNPNPLVMLTTGSATHSGSIETLPVTITGNNIPLDSLQEIAGLRFEAMVTSTMQTPITMTNLKLNDGDPEYANCVLSADTSNSNFLLIAQCGDSTVSNLLNGIPPLRIISIRPNPAQDELGIDLESREKQDAPIEIFDALGVKVFSDTRNISVGSNSIHLDTKGLSGGMYLVQVGNVSQSFVKVQ